jgi:predicted transcriptional regulator
MSHTITIRLTTELANWLQETAARTGLSQGQLVREQIAKAKAENAGRAFLRLAGAVRGPKDLSCRKGFSKP